MAAFDYIEARAIAEELIAEFGSPALLRKPGWRSGPDNDPTFTEGASFTVRAVDLDQRVVYREGVMVQEATRTLYVSTEGLPSVAGQMVVPEKSDRIAIIGEGDEGMATDAGLFQARSHEIVSVKPLAPAGVVVMWELACRV